MNKIQSVLELSKVRITLVVSLTTITGYVLGKGHLDGGWLKVTVGIFLMACGASVLNHLQEIRSDAQMERTRNRPLPGGHLAKQAAWLLAGTEVLLGTLVLGLGVNALAACLGWLALLWYNGVYTRLKRLTPHAVIPGSVVGAIPPIAGWVASGSPLAGVDCLVVALFFVVWQVPHFYLLAMHYRNDYRLAGFPSLADSYSPKLIWGIVLSWVLATVGVAFMLFLVGLIQSWLSLLIITMASGWLTGVFVQPVLRTPPPEASFRNFKRINYYVLAVILVLIFDNAWKGFLNP